MADASARGSRRLARYEVRQAIGKGSYGEVFLITHKGDGKQYVMKNIKLTASSSGERRAAEQEASLLSRLKHPNIVSYRESFQDKHHILHIIMGYCEGGDLSSRLQSYRGNLLPETQVVEWFVQIALALQYLHDRNILHRDLKTQNIFLSKNDIIKVGDLGIARVLDGSCDLARTVVGTPYYMSPELFSNQPYNHKSDIWALGCCVYEMATLKRAFSARNINALMVNIVQGKAPELPQQFSSVLSDLVTSMLAREATKRPSVHQLLRNEYVRSHIKQFLDRAAERKRKKVEAQSQPSSARRRGRRGDKQPSRQQPSPAPAIPLPGGGGGQSSLTPTGLSSARERRRQQRRDMGRKEWAAVKSTVSSDPFCQVSNGSSSDSTPAPSPSLRDRELIRQGAEETDGPGVPVQRRQPLAPTVNTDRDKSAMESVSGCSSSSSIDDDVGKGEGGESGESGDAGEEEEVYTLLDSTLHQECPEKSDVNGAMEAGDGEPVATTLRPGRLQERIAALRRECQACLSSVVVTKALSLLDSLDPEKDPDMQILYPLLGDQDHHLYAPKLRQLWLCEDALADV